MPANEQTWRDNKLMHLVFGVSSLVMLITTVWMLADDHNRSWKPYQKKFQELEYNTTLSRITEAESAGYNKQLDELTRELTAARQQVPNQKLVDQFVVLAIRISKAVKEPHDATVAEQIHGTSADIVPESPPATIARQRSDLLDLMNQIINRARFREDELAQQSKDAKAYFSQAQSQFDQAVAQSASPDAMKVRQDVCNDAKKTVDDLTLRLQTATEQRKQLEQAMGAVTAREDKAKKALDVLTLSLDQLRKGAEERAGNWGKTMLEMPVLDAFNSPLKIENNWLPQLPWNNNFREVARFDRCETCHQAIDKTAPGSSLEPGYPEINATPLYITLETPKAAPSAKPAAAPKGATKDAAPTESAAPEPPTLDSVYGFRLADRGTFNDNDVTLSAVYPGTPAAAAGLLMGDVIVEVGDARILNRDSALHYLLETVTWGQPVKLSISRGVPQPYSTHPRLDLFLGSLSPHPRLAYGCTICHQGQGSATAFKWASHSPNNLKQAKDWATGLGWFNNEHWLYPMYEQRFVESTCLKCHHEVVELEPSKKFPDPPAPKLVEGYETIRHYGCYGCHEINGFDGPNKRVGPDLRLEPNYYAVAAQLLTDKQLAKLDKQAPAWADELVVHPEDEAVRHRLLELITADAEPKNPAPVLSAESRSLAGALKDVESPGTLRKVGPSLRHVGSKVGFDFLYSWIANPKNFRPTTRMPRFFGLWDHLEGTGLAEAKKYEPIEIRAVAEYLLTASQPFTYHADKTVAERDGAIARGKKVFETRGCLACHSHADFPKGVANQGPDLSRIGAKLATNPDGRKWLVSWVREPSRYHPRTLMPVLFLEPVTDAAGVTTDPADDVAEYLMSSQQGWKPQGVPDAKLADKDAAAEDGAPLFDLALMHLKSKFSDAEAKAYLKTGIPADRAKDISGDETSLLDMTPDNRVSKTLQYVGRRTISKYGCFGCHDIPGYEDSKPIGTALADWGRKDVSKLAFEQIKEYVTEYPHGIPAEKATEKKGVAAGETPAEAEKFAEESLSPDVEFFLEKLIGHEREGFLWQKLRAPRSYDYMKTENKTYNERLRMPQFTFAAGDENQSKIERVMTFVLGLVSDPPPNQFVYHPTGPQQAIVAGHKVLEKFNCAGCHVLEMQRWDIAFKPGDFTKPPKTVDYDFLAPHFTPETIGKSEVTDRRGLAHATLWGMPMLSAADATPIRVDDEGVPLDATDTTSDVYYPFMLFDNALVDGQSRLIGQNIRVAKKQLEHDPYPFRGGDLARLLFPTVIADEVKVNPAAKDKPNEAWGWLPPPLIGEGRKVQSDWLHDFLLDPFPIRPAVVLRMPKFNMSSAEANRLVAYFAAMDEAEYPYEFDPRTQVEYLDEKEKQHANHLGEALSIVTDNNYCIKCHKVGDFSPTGDLRAVAPRLDRVHNRLRPDYVHRWLANPLRTLPYTGMPVNIPPDKPLSQKLYAGTSLEQLDAVVDLLMNFDHYTQTQVSIKARVKPPAPATAPPAAEPPAEKDTKSAPAGGEEKVTEGEAKGGEATSRGTAEKSAVEGSSADSSADK